MLPVESNLEAALRSLSAELARMHQQAELIQQVQAEGERNEMVNDLLVRIHATADRIASDLEALRGETPERP
ncbi:MAG TPA: hypothetical protein VFT69_18735 [Pseudolabrys sp.]|jgi:hypothetical protein|nr:hypothetical protein [Pseudolabrys sp.]